MTIRCFFWIFCLILFFILGCGPTVPTHLDPSDSDFSRQDSSPFLMREDYLKHAQEAWDRKDYNMAFVNFHGFAMKNPEDWRGPFFCGETKLALGNYAQALYFYRNAAHLNAKEKKIVQALIRCQQKILESEFIHPYYCKEEELKNILHTFLQFKKALSEKNWQDLYEVASLLDLLQNMGFAPKDDAELEQQIAAYLGFATSSVTLAYVDFLQVTNVLSTGTVAKIELEGLEGKNKDSVYLKKIKEAWRVVHFLSSLTPGA